jgi:hypothetical protein
MSAMNSATTNLSNDSLVWEKLLEDCEIMVKFASNNGIKLPARPVAELGIIKANIMAFKEKLTQLRDSSTTTEGKTSFTQQLEGLKKEFSQYQTDNKYDLTLIHGILVDLVAPATPQSIRVTMRTDVKGKIYIPLIKRLIRLGIILLAAYFLIDLIILCNFLPDLIKIIVQNLHILVAAGLGASFYALYTANRYVVSRTFDSTYEPYYWNRVVLGSIAGYILSLIIAPGEINTSGSIIKHITPSLVALLGGYSAEAVNQILRRLVEMLITLVKGDTQAIIKSREEEIKAKLAAQISRQRLQSSAELVKLYKQLDTKSLSEAKDFLQKIIDRNLEVS